jgi:general secretion pathway protein J
MLPDSRAKLLDACAADRARNGRPTRCAARGLPRAARQRGLTLIELLVAISVLAFVAVLGWRGLDGIVRARVALNAELDQTRGMQLAFAQMQSDCANMVSRDVLASHGAIAIDQNQFRLIRTVYADAQPTRLEVVTYRLTNGALTRRESVATRDLNELDALWSRAASGDDMTPAVTLQSGVNGFSMRVYANDGKGWRTVDTNAAEQSAANAALAALNAQAAGQPTSASHGALMNPAESAAAAATATATSLAYTGLEVVLQLQGSEQGMLKNFLLGSV